MGRNFENLHVHVGADPYARARVLGAITAYYTERGLVPVKTREEADRTIEVTPVHKGWVSVYDDAFEAAALAERVGERTRCPVLHAYCEASAIVHLTLLHEGKDAGGWGREALPPDALVAPLLGHGTPKALAEAWDQGAMQVFPESALAAAAERFAIGVDYLFREHEDEEREEDEEDEEDEENEPRVAGDLLLFQEVGADPVLEPSKEPSAVALSASVPFLVEQREMEIGLTLTSEGRAGQGLILRLSGPALEEGWLELQAGKIWVEEEPDAWTPVVDGTLELPSVRVPAGLAEIPDTWAMSRRKRDLVWAAESATRLQGKLKGRTLRWGETALEVSAQVLGSRTVRQEKIAVSIFFPPYRPLFAERASERSLLELHYWEACAGYLTLDLPADEAWRWCAPHLERLLRERKVEEKVVVEVGGEVVLERPLLGKKGKLRPVLDEIAEVLGPHRSAGLMVRSRSFAFEQEPVRPWRSFGSEPRVPALCWRGPADVVPLPALSALFDQALVDGVMLNALLSCQRSPPWGPRTQWEELVGVTSEVAGYRSWNRQRLRGLSREGVWLTPAHLARLEREEMPDHIEVAKVGAGLRLSMDRAHPRSMLRPLEEALLPVLPSREAEEAWIAAHQVPAG